MAKSNRRDNINFRHTLLDFKAARQASVWSKINRNLPYRLFQLSKNIFRKDKQKWQESKAHDGQDTKKY